MLRTWDLYEITTKESVIHGVKLRGRVRMYAINNDLELLTENATDLENAVRFALQAGSDSADVIAYIQSIVPDATIQQVMTDVKNPVLSKIIVNKVERYES